MTRWAVLLSSVAMTSTALPGTVLFVDDDAEPGGDGLTWNTAWQRLQDALADAGEPGAGVSEIRVGQGIYKPDLDEAGLVAAGDRDAAFELLDGVQLRGGYLGLSAGRSEDPDTRDVSLYPSILSGDLMGDDLPGVQFHGDNSYHVLIAALAGNTAALDGFTVTAGFANGLGDPTRDRGGAMYLEAGSPTIESCTFADNLAVSNGGAVCNLDGTAPTFVACVFTSNDLALYGSGGAVYNSGSTASFLNCTFQGQVILGDCGAVENNESDTAFVDCTFEGNAATLGPGAVCNFHSDAVFTRCTFIDNHGDEAVRIIGSSPTFTDCVFSGNVGGAIRSISSSSNSTAVGCLFLNNEPDLGGVIRSSTGSMQRFERCSFLGNNSNGGTAVASAGTGSEMEFVNCLFSANSSDSGPGAALISAFTGAVAIVNCTLAGNPVAAVAGSSGVNIVNSVIWDNAGSLNVPENDQVTYSIVEGGWPGVGNLDGDPRFVDPDRGDFRLSPGSPAIDSGDSPALPPEVTTDLDSNPRFLDDHCRPDTGVPDADGVVVDRGAYEFQATSCDLDFDGMVGTTDLLVLLGAWGPCGDCTDCPDLDGDCIVGASDLLLLLGHWG